MAYAKKNNESSAVVACIRRKAKALGCPFSKDSLEAEIDEILADYTQRQQAAAAAPVAPPAADAAQAAAPPAAPAPAVVAAPEAQVQAASDDCSCKELEDQLKALRAELRDIYNEHEQLEELHAQVLDNHRQALATVAANYDMITARQVKDVLETAKLYAAMPLEELAKKVTDLANVLDVKTVIGKLNTGMTSTPTVPVASPVLQDSTPNAADAQGDKYGRFKQTYNKIKAENGLKAADAYVDKLRRARLVPAEFNPVK